MSKTVRILRTLGSDDKRRLFGPDEKRDFRERAIVDLDDEKADALIKEGKAWEMGSESERKDQESRNADILAQAQAAAEREAVQEAAAKEAKDALAKAKAAHAVTPGAPTTSPVAALNADEAIVHVGAMRSKDKLQSVIDNDSRVTVQEAARKRLAEL